MAKLVDGFKDGRPELGRRTFLVPENHSEVLALLYHEQTGIVGGLPVGPVTTDPFGATTLGRLARALELKGLDAEPATDEAAIAAIASPMPTRRPC